MEPGQRLQNRYEIDQILGQGGMGCVYLARQTALDRRLVAIKAMKNLGLPPQEAELAQRLFQREAYILSHLDHPGLVSVLDYFSEGGTSYLVMHYVRGQSLGTLVQRAPTPFPVGLILNWAEQLAVVLQYLHELAEPIIFRDLKPANVMLDAQNRIKLIDFGIARIFDPESATTTFVKGAGTAGFAPVEQYGGSTDVRTDVYAFGATLYCLLTRSLPPVSVNLLSGESVLVPPEQLNPEVSLPLSEVLTRMMALRKTDRYPSVAEAMADLRRVPAKVWQPSRADCPECGATSLPLLTSCFVCGTGSASPPPISLRVAEEVPTVSASAATAGLIAAVPTERQAWPTQPHTPPGPAERVVTSVGRTPLVTAAEFQGTGLTTGPQERGPGDVRHSAGGLRVAVWAILVVAAVPVLCGAIDPFLVTALEYLNVPLGILGSLAGPAGAVCAPLLPALLVLVRSAFRRDSYEAGVGLYWLSAAGVAVLQQFHPHNVAEPTPGLGLDTAVLLRWGHQHGLFLAILDQDVRLSQLGLGLALALMLVSWLLARYRSAQRVDDF